jgi:predicted alpha/beta superfamily hydrolase
MRHSRTAHDSYKIQDAENCLPEEHTIQGNVKIIPQFYLKNLHRRRRLWVYLPPDYHHTKKHFPVLYMNDGQNLFDHYSSYCGEWMVDKALDHLFFEHKMSGIIVVGIDNGADYRLEEYCPYDFHFGAKRGKGKGDYYLKDLVEGVRPFMDKHFRTLPEDTGIGGSSLGGFISLYAAFRYPHIFKRVLALSPSIWFAGDLIEYARKTASHPWRIYIDVGTNESRNQKIRREYRQGAVALHQVLKKMGTSTHLVVEKGGIHHESAWAQRFPGAVLWTYGKSIT